MKKTLLLLLIFLVVVAGGVLAYLYYFIASPFQEKKADGGPSPEVLFTGNANSGTNDPLSPSFEEAFYADLSDLFDVEDNFYEDIQGEYGFTESGIRE